MEITTAASVLSEATPPAREDQKRPRIHDDHSFAPELSFTAAYREHIDAHPAVREGWCLRAQVPHILGPIEPHDLLAGRIEPALVGFTPDEWGSCAFGYYALASKIDEALERSDVSPGRRRDVEAMRDFWMLENTAAKVRAAYPEDLDRLLPSDDWMGEPGIGFPLYRLTGGTVDYDKLLRWGIPGLKSRIDRALRRAHSAGRDTALYDGMRLAVGALTDACRSYEREARRQIVGAQGLRRSELVRLAETLQMLPLRAPRSFHEALQLFWLYSIVGDIRNHGRLDVALGDFLAADLDAGTLSQATALRLLQSLWELMADRNTRVHNRVIIGGSGRRNPENADRFAELAIEASRTVLEAEPQLSLRFRGGMRAPLMDAALETIAAGRTFPMLYNDDANIPAVMEAFGVDRKTAEQYVPFGCGEYIIQGQSFGTPSGVINLLQALNVTLHGGIDPVTGRVLGLREGGLPAFRDFDALFAAYRRQVEHFVDLLARQQKIEYDVAGREASFLFFSMLYDDCMDRGLGMFDGGVRHLGGTLETYGNANTADSLTAIRKIVFDERRVGPEELLDALQDDFEGHERLRMWLANAPKYGNDDDVADAMLTDVHDHVCKYVKSRAREVGLDSYLVVIINNSANTLMGRHTGASADGRRAFTPMNNGNNPSSGADRCGVTAFLNSIVKPSTAIHAGAVQNMKFSADLFTRYRENLEALLDTYFESGGAQAMITVVSRRDLEQAMVRPAEYQHVFVRVGGFSARFVDLPSDVQREILERTLY